MKNAAATPAIESAPHPTVRVQQLSLLPDVATSTKVHARFLLSQDTRELGMRQVAEIRQVLADRKAARESATVFAMPARTTRAA